MPSKRLRGRAPGAGKLPLGPSKQSPGGQVEARWAAFGLLGAAWGCLGLLWVAWGCLRLGASANPWSADPSSYPSHLYDGVVKICRVADYSIRPSGTPHHQLALQPTSRVPLFYQYKTATARRTWVPSPAPGGKAAQASAKLHGHASHPTRRATIGQGFLISYSTLRARTSRVVRWRAAGTHGGGHSAVVKRPSARPAHVRTPRGPRHVQAALTGRRARPKRRHGAPLGAHRQSSGVRLTRGPSGGPHS